MIKEMNWLRITLKARGWLFPYGETASKIQKEELLLDGIETQ